METSRIESLLAFLPARDFALSRRFYADLGFTERWASPDACELVRDGAGFILQDFHVPEHSGNFMMAMQVSDADAWWRHIEASGLPQKYALRRASPPALQPWGRRVLFLSDPSGVLWHISDQPKDTTLYTSRVLRHRPDAVYQAFADAGQLAAWWGPEGFTNEFEIFEFKPGGHWKFVMQGPDGTRHPNDSRFVALEPGRLVVIRHDCAPFFTLTVRLAPAPDGTLLVWEQAFDDAKVAEALAFVAPFNEQNLDRLERSLAASLA